MDSIIGGLLGCLYTTVGYLCAVWTITGRMPFRVGHAPVRPVKVSTPTPLTQSPEKDAARANESSGWISRATAGLSPMAPGSPPGAAIPDFNQERMRRLEEKYSRGRKT